MNSVQYRNFISVADHGSITHAANELLIAQPALTIQIKRIEEEFGSPLFIRHARSVELTDAGKVLYQTAKNILRLEENTLTEIKNISSGDGGVLRLGITQFMPDPFLEQMFETYYKTYPNVFVSLYEQTCDDLLSTLKNGIVELAIVRTPTQLPAPFKVVAKFNESLYACRTPECPYLPQVQQGVPIQLKTLEGIPLSAPRGLHSYLNDCCLKAGFTPSWGAISSSRHSTLKLAEYGKMVAILTMAKELILENTDFLCNELDSSDITIHRYFVILEGRELSATTKNFIELIKSHLQ